MESGQPSRTAYSAARYRAAHQILEGGAIFADPLAARFFGRPDVPPETPGGHVLHAVR